MNAAECKRRFAELKVYKSAFDSALDKMVQTIEDIIFGRIKDGWPTRESAAPEEDC